MSISEILFNRNQDTSGTASSRGHPSLPRLSSGGGISLWHSAPGKRGTYPARPFLKGHGDSRFEQPNPNFSREPKGGGLLMLKGLAWAEQKKTIRSLLIRSNDGCVVKQSGKNCPRQEKPNTFEKHEAVPAFIRDNFFARLSTAEVLPSIFRETKHITSTPQT